MSFAFYYYDANGNVTDLVGTNGEFLAQYQFDPYGNTISKAGALADVNPFRFSTKYLDAETGLYYYGYRYYQPETGRFVGRDPLFADEVSATHVFARFGFASILRQSADLWLSYEYTGNEPIGRQDLLGLTTIVSPTPPVTEEHCAPGDVYIWNQPISAWCPCKPGFPGQPNGTCTCTRTYLCVKITWPFWPFWTGIWKRTTTPAQLSCPEGCSNITDCKG